MALATTRLVPRHGPPRRAAGRSSRRSRRRGKTPLPAIRPAKATCRGATLGQVVPGSGYSCGGWHAGRRRNVNTFSPSSNQSSGHEAGAERARDPTRLHAVGGEEPHGPPGALISFDWLGAPATPGLATLVVFGSRTTGGFLSATTQQRDRDARIGDLEVRSPSAGRERLSSPQSCVAPPILQERSPASTGLRLCPQ
jgi:hypothetical protein